MHVRDVSSLLPITLYKSCILAKIHNTLRRCLFGSQVKMILICGPITSHALNTAWSYIRRHNKCVQRPFLVPLSLFPLAALANGLNQRGWTRITGRETVTSQHVGQPRGKVEGVLCIAFEIAGFFHAFNSKT
jgi:hypothetical protein